MRADLGAARHWVIKIGSGVLLRDTAHVDRPTFVRLVRSVVALRELGHQVTLVSSGAVAIGRQIAGDLSSTDLATQQALAAMGQARLIQMYDREFREYEVRAAQVLFARRDLDHRASFLNARVTLQSLHRIGAVPILNENDTVTAEGIRFDDNDELASIVCGLVKADLLVILSDVEGVLEVVSDGAERRFGDRISMIEAEDPRLVEVAGPSVSGHGRGGMTSKIRAARTASRLGIPAVIARGKRSGVLESIARGEDVGTLIMPGRTALSGRKIWLGGAALAAGRIVVDDGAARAVLEQGASLLPRGIAGVEGDFGEGEVVELVRGTGEAIARGLVAYASDEVRQIAGHSSEEIAELLGYRRIDEVVHRDSLVVLT